MNSKKWLILLFIAVFAIAGTGGFLLRSWTINEGVRNHSEISTVVEADDDTSNENSGKSKTTGDISENKAIKIAEKDLQERGINAHFSESSGIDTEHGQRIWELEFRNDRHVFEYYINVETGTIAKFEQETND
ncbi:PepSY domain-containing protein [Lactococcus nasutitermitis]|uniref:PepSY domain-containing protein n=1 Tax=Lactococcus nasutitermitis TaxID=1652957 RepID=A0ABV9JBX7_9LACT|nr:PepSY domain-containing protein [Lactococcus nasutitermitis]